MNETTNNPTNRDRADVYFRTDHLKSELKRRTVRGGAVTMLSQTFKFALNLGSTFVLFRLLKLTPEDVGLVAMVTVVTGVINLFKDMGLSRATVQRDEITHEQTSGLFWINAAVGAAAMLAAWALAPAVAWFYDSEPRLIPIMLAMGSGFLVSGLSVQHQALMQRQMQFAKLAVIDLSAMLFATALAVVAAAFLDPRYGYWALVVQQLAGVAANSVGQWIACPWRPGRPARGAGLKSMLKFGGNLAGFNIINYLQRHVDAVLVGKVAGESALGLYNKAFSLLMLPINQVNTPMSNVAVPALSRLQNDPAQYRSYYRKAIGVLTAVTMPIVALLFVVADELVPTLLGEQFRGTVPIFRWLAVAAFIGTFHVATGWVYVSLGHTDRQLRMILVVAPVTVLSFFLGAYFGKRYWGDGGVEGLGAALGVAAAGSISTVLLRYPTILYCFRGTPVTQRDLFSAIWRPATASIAAGGALYAFSSTVNAHHSPAVRLVVESALYGVAYVLCWLVLPGGRRFITDFGGLFKEMMNKKKAARTKPAPGEAATAPLGTIQPAAQAAPAAP